jgi:hypothetical protein
MGIPITCFLFNFLGPVMITLLNTRSQINNEESPQ